MPFASGVHPVMTTVSTEKKDKAGLGIHLCDNCSSPESSEKSRPLMACARCGLVVYCSKDCQRAHWKANAPAVKAPVHTRRHGKRAALRIRSLTPPLTGAERERDRERARNVREMSRQGDSTKRATKADRHAYAGNKTSTLCVCSLAFNPLFQLLLPLRLANALLNSAMPVAFRGVSWPI